MMLTCIAGIIGLAAGVQERIRYKNLLNERIMLNVRGLLIAHPGVMTDTVGNAIMEIATGVHLIRTLA